MLHGRTIRLVRVAKGMSQDELADHIGITKVYVSKIEKGERRVTERFERRFRELFADDAEQIDALTSILQNMMKRDGSK
ncbi:helix-turn-helix domain-containing protein [Tumebacillus permanentifrigoris]|uniref:Helix-turn-helix protein n=1 Tax=Tumebacillus permanentifrigoris TaxID=378543 RepID=A0A316D6I4_9BACL|nr:helix-turn-helix transcriptional regulator [Tumebacillus permanentifrigoris]PWK07035.1 helix-turn-helix protein [Tumebacillus permanentifrigoris]